MSTISKIGGCNVCNWREEDFKKDVCKLAREHSKKYKHDTWVEVGRVYQYKNSPSGAGKKRIEDYGIIF
jgi:hypothetical protein